MKIKRNIIFFIFLVLINSGCVSSSNNCSNSNQSLINNVNNKNTASITTGKFYTGDGGKGIRLGIIVPENSGLNEIQSYIPRMIQGSLVSNFSKYSAISVLDRVSLDKVITETLDPVYKDNLDIVRLGHVAHTQLIMTGNIIRTSTGYTLHLNITETKPNGTTIASYSGNHSVAQFDDFTAVNNASKELLEQMGVQLTNTAKNELSKPSSPQTINAQASLARGINAQQKGTIVEAFANYYDAVFYDPELSEALGRVSNLSSGISSGTIGENVRNDIQRRDEWIKLLTEAEDFFSKHLPFEIIYSNSLTQGEIDYKTRKVELLSNIILKPSNSFNTFSNILSGLNATGKTLEWGLEYWPALSVHQKYRNQNEPTPGLFSRRNFHASYYPRTDARNSAEKDINISVGLINENGKLISRSDVLLRSEIQFALGKGETYTGSINNSQYRIYYKNRWYELDITKLEASEVQGKIRFIVNADDISDNLTIKILNVNNIDVTKNIDFIKIISR